MSSGTGLRSWLIQRATAVFMIAYVLVLGVFVYLNPGMNYEQWHGFMSQPWVQIATFILLVSVGFHGWVGMWTVATDYIKPAFLRLGFLGFFMALLFIYFAWGIKILWG